MQISDAIYFLRHDRLLRRHWGARVTVSYAPACNRCAPAVRGAALHCCASSAATSCCP